MFLRLIWVLPRIWRGLLLIPGRAGRPGVGLRNLVVDGDSAEDNKRECAVDERCCLMENRLMIMVCTMGLCVVLTYGILIASPSILVFCVV